MIIMRLFLHVLCYESMKVNLIKVDNRTQYTIRHTSVSEILSVAVLSGWSIYKYS